MGIFLQSFGLIAVSELGDKTQILALILTLRFKKPWSVMLGIFIATLANHGAASFFGHWLGTLFPENLFKIILSLVFFIFSIWLLIPDEFGKTGEKITNSSNVFMKTVILFFLLEMGDKTQLITIALAAKFKMPITVIVGTTLGMLLTNGLVVFGGRKIVAIFPMKIIRIVSAILFIIFGLSIWVH